MKQAQILCCRVGREWYGIPVEQVVEVLQLVALNEIPGAKPDILGLLTLRDVVMPVIDLRVRFGASNTDLSLDTPVIAIHTSQGPAAVVVDDVDDVNRVTNVDDEQGHESPYTSGVARLGERVLLLIDVNRLRESAAETV